MLVVSALDHRFGWSQVPIAVIVVGNVLVAVGLGLAQLVVIQNSYAAATITVEAEQKVVSTGLYGVVRHPDVRRRADHDGRHTACARLVLGTRQRSSPALPSWHCASSTRRRCSGRSSTGYREYIAEGALPVGALRLVKPSPVPSDEGVDEALRFGKHRAQRATRAAARRDADRSARRPGLCRDPEQEAELAGFGVSDWPSLTDVRS